MSRKTKPQTDDVLDEELDDLDEAVADLDEEPAPRKKKAAGDRTKGKRGSESAKEDSKGSKRDSASSKGGSAKKSRTGRGSGKSSGSKSVFMGGGGKRPGGKAKGGKSSRRPVAPVRVSAERPWGTIAMFAVVAALFVGIVGYTGWVAWYSAKSPEERAGMIDGMQDHSKEIEKIMKRAGDKSHKKGDLKYKVHPPVGGVHHPVWQKCDGEVYDKQIADEHAVHSLEHGTVWITYRPDLPKSQVKKLAKRVNGKEYMMLSPYKGLDSPISLQAWGYRLKVKDAGDSRIDDFIEALRAQGPEKGADCTQGVTRTGTQPRDVDPPQQPGMPGQPGAPAPPPPGGGAPPPPGGGQPG